MLGGVQLSASVSQNIMRQIADMKLTPVPVSKPVLPWVAFGAAAVSLVLLIGFSNRYLVRFQKPYSFEAKSKPTIEIIEAPTVLDIDAKPAVRNQIGRADTEDKSSGTSVQMDETVSMSRALEDSRDFSTAQWMPDAELRTAVREALTLPEAVPLTKERMQALQHLNAGGKGITDIRGLEFARNLVELHLGDEGNYVTDLSPLATLTALTNLNVGGNQVADLRPLANLTYLTGLSLWNNQVTDVSPLRSLTALTYLNLANNRVSDLGPLANLTSLEKLDLFDNEVKNLVPLSGLRDLKHLILTHNRVEDLNPLARLVNLQILWIKKNPIKDLNPLARLNLTDLKYDGLSLAAEQIEPPEIWMPDPALWMAVRGELGLLPGVPLTREKMLQLERIEVNYNDTVNLTGLEFAKNLRILDLNGNNHITDLHSIANLLNLVELHIWRSEDAPPMNLDILPLANLTNLEEVTIENCGISDISILTNFTKLQRLYLEDNHIEDFLPLAGLTSSE